MTSSSSSSTASTSRTTATTAQGREGILRDGAYAQTGGIVPAASVLVYDELSGRFANGTLRITSRQTFQFHGVLQQGIGSLIKSINEALSSTLATCGDVNRNVMGPSNPPVDAITQAIEDDSFTLTRALLPKTTSYHSIW
jgi:sulfite reductase (NADPH) hemoprotein beta-component